MKKVLSLFLTMILSCSMLTGCAPIKNKIAYTIYPIEYILNRLTDETIEYESIQTDSIIQRATLKSNYKEILENSAVLMHVGQLEPYLPLYSSEISETEVSRLDLSSLNAVYKFQRYTPVFANNQVTYIEGPYYDDPAFDILDVDTIDLYLWTDPIVMLSMAKDICKWLDNKFPEKTQVFDENLKDLETDLINLDAQYQSLSSSLLNNNKKIRFVTMTSSFGNWQKTYNFEVYPVILSKYGALPTKSQLEVIKNRIVEDNVKYIVYEPNMTEDMIQLFDELQEELGLTRVELSNLSSLTEDEKNSGKDYISIMYENLQVLELMAENRE